MKQYTITEENEWEGETFGYILDLDTEILAKIEKGFEAINMDYGVEILRIEESNYTEQDVQKINNASSNTYMDRLNFYRLQENLDLNNFEYDQFPYKGSGMICTN